MKTKWVRENEDFWYLGEIQPQFDEIGLENSPTQGFFQQEPQQDPISEPESEAEYMRPVPGKRTRSDIDDDPDYETEASISSPDEVRRTGRKRMTPNNRGECFFIVDLIRLTEPLCNKSCLVLVDASICITLDFDDLFATDCLLTTEKFGQFEHFSHC